MEDEYGNDMEDTSGYEKSEVRHTWVGSEDLVLVLSPAGLGLQPAIAGMLKLLAHEILLSPSLS